MKRISGIILTIKCSHKIKTGNIIKVSKWGYNNDDFVKDQMSFVHSFISAN